jgi:hypothetical protein
MKIKESVKQELQTVLGQAIPEPSDPKFNNFYAQLELHDSKLAAKLIGALEDDAPDSILFPEQIAQAETRSKAKEIMQKMFYRQDPYTHEWALAKGKVGLAALGGILCFLMPMMLVTPSSGKAAPAPAVASKAEPFASLPTVAMAQDAPVEPTPLEATPIGTAPTTEAIPDVPAPVAEAAPVQVESAPLPAPVQYSAPVQTYQPRATYQQPTYQQPTNTYRAPVASVPKAPRRPGGVVFKKRSSGQPANSSVMFTRQPAANTANANIGVPRENTGNGPLTLFKREKPVPAPTVEIASAANQAPVLEVPTPAAPVAAPAVQVQAPVADSPLAAGMIIPASLATGIILAEGETSVPIVVRTETGITFLGEAKLNKARRMEIHLTEYVIDGKSYPINAQVFSPDGYPGVSVAVNDMAPDLFNDLLRGTANGVTNYVNGLIDSSRTTLVAGGGAVTDRNQVPLGSSIAGALADLFSLPQGNKAVIRVAQVQSGTSILVTVLSVKSSDLDSGNR